jgi:hypothetical protein
LYDLFTSSQTVSNIVLVKEEGFPIPSDKIGQIKGKEGINIQTLNRSTLTGYADVNEKVKITGSEKDVKIIIDYINTIINNPKNNLEFNRDNIFKISKEKYEVAKQSYIKKQESSATKTEIDMFAEYEKLKKNNYNLDVNQIITCNTYKSKYIYIFYIWYFDRNTTYTTNDILTAKQHPSRFEPILKCLFISQFIYKVILKYIENKNTDTINLDDLNDELYNEFKKEALITNFNEMFNNSNDFNKNINDFARAIYEFISKNKDKAKKYRNLGLSQSSEEAVPETKKLTPTPINTTTSAPASAPADRITLDFGLLTVANIKDFNNTFVDKYNEFENFVNQDPPINKYLIKDKTELSILSKLLFSYILYQRFSLFCSILYSNIDLN